MRRELAKSEGQRKRFRGVFVRIGRKTNYNGYSEDTILIKEIVDVATNQLITDHVWFTFTKVFEKANVREGSVIEFDARVKEYKKGYVNKQLKKNYRTVDYKLSHPTKITVVDK